MAPPTGSLFDTHRQSIEEVLGKQVSVFLASIDPIWNDLIINSTGVSPVDELGRDYNIHHTYMNAVGGVFESGAPRNDFALYGDPNNTAYGSKLYASGTPTGVWPDASEDPGSLRYRLSIPMRSILTQMRLEMAELRAEATPAFIGNIIAPRMKAWSLNLARYICRSWYVSQATNYRLAALGSSSGTDAYVRDNTAKTVVFYPSNKAIMRFAVGDRVDIIRTIANSGTDYFVRINDTNLTATPVYTDAAGQLTTTRVKCFVSKVAPFKNQVTLQFDPATTVPTTTMLSTDAYIVPANSVLGGVSNGSSFKDIAGLSSWMKFGTGVNATDTPTLNPDNFLLGAEAVGSADIGWINVNTHPEFASFLKSVSGVLTEHRLNTYLDRTTQAMDPVGEYLDTLVTTTGVIRAAMLQKEGRAILDRTGRTSSLANEGEDGSGFTHHHNGRAYKIHVSDWQNYGQLDGYRRTNNWVRAVPPRLARAATMQGVNPAIPLELAAPVLTGTSSSIFPVLTSTGKLTQMSQMPGQVAMQIYPKSQVRGLRLTNLTEERVYSDLT